VTLVVDGVLDGCRGLQGEAFEEIGLVQGEFATCGGTTTISERSATSREQSEARTGPANRTIRGPSDLAERDGGLGKEDAIHFEFGDYHTNGVLEHTLKLDGGMDESRGL